MSDGEAAPMWVRKMQSEGDSSRYRETVLRAYTELAVQGVPPRWLNHMLVRQFMERVNATEGEGP